MKVLVVRFAVKNDAEADSLMNEISARISNEFGMSWHSAKVCDAEPDDIRAVEKEEMKESRWW